MHNVFYKALTITSVLECLLCGRIWGVSFACVDFVDSAFIRSYSKHYIGPIPVPLYQNASSKLIPSVAGRIIVQGTDQ